MNSELRFGKERIGSLPSGVTGISSGSTRENSDGIATFYFNDGCSVVLFK